MSVKPIPEGYTSLTPFLCIDGTAAAIDFYTSVFGAKLVDSIRAPQPLTPSRSTARTSPPRNVTAAWPSGRRITSAVEPLT